MKRLVEKDLETFLVKDKVKKFEFVRDFIENRKFKVSNVVYFTPKKYQEDVRHQINKVHIFCYEDINKTNEPHDILNEKSLLIMDGSARYKSITSYVFKRLSNLALIPSHKLMVDIVPFTTSIEYAYIPFSHLERQILGHQHWYAFRENNMEYNESGELVEGHDFELLAGKMAPYTKMDYPHFMEHETETIKCELTNREQEEYDKYRDGLFKKYNTIQPILTRLADFTNTRPSRYLNLQNVVNSLSGKTIVYTNIKSHNSNIKKTLQARPDVEVRTFYDHNTVEHTADNIVLAEVPIVRNYLFLDVIANAKRDCKFYFITGYSTIDELLFAKMKEEFEKIDTFTKILRRKIDEWHAKQEENSI